MTSRSIFLTALCSIALVATFLTRLVFAHHSPAEFDHSHLVELDGIAREVMWRNPHILIELATRDSAGREIAWTLEGAAVSNQQRRGVTAGMLKPGDVVRVAGYASMRRPAYMSVEHVLLPNGSELLVGAAREARWSDKPVGGAARALSVGDDATGPGRGIFRVWTRDVGYWPWFFRDPAEFELTDWAAAHVAAFDQFEDNPLLDCTKPGMPALMGNPYPMEFIDHGDTIEVRFEEFDVVRTIHVGNVRDPADVAPSPLGYSVGHWDGDALIVTTTRINWPHFGRVGMPQTEGVRVVERFAVRDAENRIDYSITMTDPEVFAGSLIWEAPYVWRAGEAVGVYACTVEG